MKNFILGVAAMIILLAGIGLLLPEEDTTTKPAQDTQASSNLRLLEYYYQDFMGGCSPDGLNDEYCECAFGVLYDINGVEGFVEYEKQDTAGEEEPFIPGMQVAVNSCIDQFEDVRIKQN